MVFNPLYCHYEPQKVLHYIFVFFVKYRPWFVTGNGNNNIPIYTAFRVNGRISDSIGIARVLRLGGQMSTMSTYPLVKTENSSDLVHYFLGEAPK